MIILSLDIKKHKFSLDISGMHTCSLYKSMHTYLKIRNKHIGVHTNLCWSLTDSPAIPSFGVSLGWTSFAKALNDDGGHLTASYPCKKTSDYKLCFTQLESNLQSTRIIVHRKHLLKYPCWMIKVYITSYLLHITYKWVQKTFKVLYQLC